MKYSKLIEDGGKTYLLAEDLYADKAAQVGRLAAAYTKARAMLIDAGFSAGKAWIKAVTEQGADGLEQVLRQSVSQEIKRLSVPFYMAQTYQAAAKDSVSRELWAEADAVRMAVQRESDGLPLEAGDITITDDAVTVNTEAILSRVRVACTQEVTDGLKADAAQVLELASTVRTLELAGLNALELVKKYVDSPERPAQIDLYADMCTRRHIPGQVSAVIQMPLTTFATMYKPK